MIHPSEDWPDIAALLELSREAEAARSAPARRPVQCEEPDFSDIQRSLAQHVTDALNKDWTIPPILPGLTS